MAFTEFETACVEAAMSVFMEKRRPPEEIRSKVDLAFRIEDQSVIIFEIRPLWRKPEKITEESVGKATYVRGANQWKVFWQRSDLKWHSYEPSPLVARVEDFLSLVDEDKHGCFWG